MSQVLRKAVWLCFYWESFNGYNDNACKVLASYSFIFNPFKGGNWISNIYDIAFVWLSQTPDVFKQVIYNSPLYVQNFG